MLSDDEFRKLLDVLDRPWAGFRKIRKGVKKRVRRHMEVLGCSSLEDYIQLIEQKPEHRDECEARLRVTISRFFRDRQLWEHLEKRILPELLLRFPNGLKAWSAGCANGEEPYSLSIILEQLITSNKASPPLQILATDSSVACIERAMSGQYPRSSLKEIPEDLKARWFQKVPGKHQWRIDPLPGTHIEWLVHDLLEVPPGEAFHLILLRNNLLTYYQGAVLQTALENITRSLVAGGVVILGSREQLPPCIPLDRDSVCPWIYHTEAQTK